MKPYKLENKMKQDIKRIALRHYELEKLYKVIDILCEGGPIPPEYRNHPLHGDKTGKYDLHIENDWLLVYYITNDFVYLSRTGTHSDLKLMK
jgi:mRNA interferase YafQ